MPFPDRDGPVAERFQQLAQHPLAARNSVVRDRRIDGRVPACAETILIPPGDQPRSARPTHRVRVVGLREDDPLGRNPVDVRRLDVRRAMEADIRVALIVGQDHHNVGRSRGLGLGVG